MGFCLPAPLPAVGHLDRSPHQRSYSFRFVIRKPTAPPAQGPKGPHLGVGTRRAGSDRLSLPLHPQLLQALLLAALRGYSVQWKDPDFWNLDPVPALNLPVHSMPQSLSPLWDRPGFISPPHLWETVVLLPHFTAGEVEARDSLAHTL